MATIRQPYPLRGTRFVNTGAPDITGPHQPARPGTVGTGDLVESGALAAGFLVDASGIPRMIEELAGSGGGGEAGAAIDPASYQSALPIPILDDSQLDRFRLVVRAFTNAGLEKKQIATLLRGINFAAVALPLRLGTLQRNALLRQLQAAPAGNWYRLLPGINPLDLRGTEAGRDLFLLSAACPAVALVEEGGDAVFSDDPAGEHYFIRTADLGKVTRLTPAKPAGARR
jgi:hypothetical protein